MKLTILQNSDVMSKNGCRIRSQRPKINKVWLVSDKVYFCCWPVLWDNYNGGRTWYFFPQISAWQNSTFVVKVWIWRTNSINRLNNLSLPFLILLHCRISVFVNSIAVYLHLGQLNFFSLGFNTIWIIILMILWKYKNKFFLFD